MQYSDVLTPEDFATFEKKLAVYMQFGHTGFQIRWAQTFGGTPPRELCDRLIEASERKRWKSRLGIWFLDQLAKIIVLIAFVAVILVGVAIVIMFWENVMEPAVLGQ